MQCLRENVRKTVKIRYFTKINACLSAQNSPFWLEKSVNGNVQTNFMLHKVENAFLSVQKAQFTIIQ